MKNIAFIINPTAGTGGTKTKNRLNKLLRDLLDTEQFSPIVVTTEYAGHATQLAQQFAMQEYYAVVAVGGDGTVNEVASGVAGTNTALGIVPNGSGNGFARHLDISTRMNRAIEMLNNSEAIKVDYCTVNDIPFFATCGIGFDAQVAQDFEQSERGLKGYLQTITKDIFNYKSDNYHLVGDGIDIETKAFLINFANASQWGNDAYIAPKASIQDGVMDIAIINKLPIVKAPEFLWQLFTKTLDENLHVNTIRAKEIRLIRENQTSPIHIDGSPTHMDGELHIKVVEEGLKVLVKKRF